MSSLKPGAVRLSVAALAALFVVTACSSNSSSSSSSKSPGSAAQSPASSASPSPSVTSSTPSASPGSSGASGPATSRPAATSVDTGTKAPYPTPTNGKVPNVPPDQSEVLDGMSGSSSNSCQRVGTQTVNLRAGSVAAGNFVTARRTYRDQVSKTEVPEVALYLIPTHAKSMPGVTVQVDPVGAGKTKTIRSHNVEQANQYRYYALTVPVPKPGTYRLKVAAASDQGCFEVSFNR